MGGKWLSPRPTGSTLATGLGQALPYGGQGLDSGSDTHVQPERSPHLSYLFNKLGGSPSQLTSPGKVVPFGTEVEEVMLEPG